MKYKTGEEPRDNDVVWKRRRFYVVSGIYNDGDLFGNLPGGTLQDNNEFIGQASEFTFIQRGPKRRYT